MSHFSPGRFTRDTLFGLLMATRGRGAGAAWLLGVLSEASSGDPAVAPRLASSGGLTQWRPSGILVAGSRGMLAVALRGMVAVTRSQTERNRAAGRDSERPPEFTVGIRVGSGTHSLFRTRDERRPTSGFFGVYLDLRTKVWEMILEHQSFPSFEYCLRTQGFWTG